MVGGGDVGFKIVRKRESAIRSASVVLSHALSSIDVNLNPTSTTSSLLTLYFYHPNYD